MFLELSEVGLINPPLRVLEHRADSVVGRRIAPEETAYLPRLNKLPGDPLKNRRQFIASRRRLATFEKLGQLRFSIEFVFGVLIIQRAFELVHGPERMIDRFVDHAVQAQPDTVFVLVPDRIDEKVELVLLRGRGQLVVVAGFFLGCGRRHTG